MFSKNQDTLKILVDIQKNELLNELIQQLNKDFNLSGVDFQIEEGINPLFLLNEVIDVVSVLVENDFHKLMNLLYRIDVSENKFLEIKEIDIQIISQKVTLLILKKEWQKIWLRNRNL